MNCKSLKPENHYFWFQLQSEENDRIVHFLVRVMLKLEKDAMGFPLKSHCFHRSHLTPGLDPDFIIILIPNIQNH